MSSFDVQFGDGCINTTLLSSFLCRDGPSVRLTGWCLWCARSTSTCLRCDDDRAIRCAREGAAGIGEGSSSRQAASTTTPQALVRIGVEQWMTRKDILFPTTATYCIPDVHSLLFICWLGDVFSVVLSDIQKRNPVLYLHIIYLLHWQCYIYSYSFLYCDIAKFHSLHSNKASHGWKYSVIWDIVNNSVLYAIEIFCLTLVKKHAIYQAIVFLYMFIARAAVVAELCVHFILLC